MFSEPTIIQHVKYFNLQSVEVIVNWNKEPLSEVQFRIYYFSWVKYIGIACESHKNAMIERKMSERIYFH
jgi:hypothetical protein